MEYLQISWVDLVIVSVLIVGMVRGRKRGISEELLDMLKWVFIVLVGAFAYGPLGDLMADLTPFSHYSCYVAVYGLVLVSGLVLFSSIKTAVGEKIVASDAFGDGEYYLGVFAGAFRYSLIILVILNFINARHYEPHEANARVQSQMKNFGMVFFTMPQFQEEIFKHSFLGRQVDDYLSFFMIAPSSPENKALGGSNNRRVNARERSFNEILD